ncbi:lipocalin family protein [Pyrinomonas sp.]|uniref:lipocalin family protein n=1 Tax=Pyrinomonas sp. TaxID=2080306 RepID=UPI00332294C2
MEIEFSNPVERLAAQALDKLADLIVGPASTLRDGTEHRGVELPRDLYAHREAQTEWWYYTGHVETENGRRLGFEWVFFKRRTDLDRFGVVPLRLIANPLYLAHFALTDITCGRFRYAHRKSANGPWELPAGASVRRYYLRLGDWTARELHGLHILRGTLDDLTFEVALKPEKPPVLNGHNGVSFKDHGEASRYFSFTRMSAEGEIAWRRRVERFAGQAWMDREFGTWRATENQRGWDWFSLQLSDNTELMVYHIRDGAGRPSAFSSGTFVDAEGRSTHLQREDFSLKVLGRWRSPHTGAIYPSGWQIQVPRLSLDLTVRPLLEDQELDTRGTTMVIYWEGACEVTGRREEQVIDGQAYVELVGYDRSHESPSFATFLFGNALDRRWRSIFG